MRESPLGLVLGDAVEVLDGLGLRYALVGALAAVCYGSTRATRDVDLSVSLPAGDRQELLAALRRKGFSRVQRRGSVIQAAHPTGYRLDLLLAESEFERSLVENARPRKDLGVDVRVAGLEDVVVFKLIGGRPRDLRDVEELVEENPGIDWRRISRRLAGLGVSIQPDECRQAAGKEDLRHLLQRLSRSLRE